MPEAKYGVASWPEERGNHRALVQVSEKAHAVRANIPWRRRDDAAKKAIWVFDSATRERITNVARLDINRDFGEIAFQPATVPGTYEIYYIPYIPPKSNVGDSGIYPEPDDTTDPAWLQSVIAKQNSLPQVELIEIQARSEFHRFDPMEVAATADEVNELVAKHAGLPYLIFPEDRMNPIRMFDQLPTNWIKNGHSSEFTGDAQPNEFYAFQIGLFAAREEISNLSIRFGDLKTSDGKVIPASALRCFNLGGTDWLGRPFEKNFNVNKGIVGALWIGVDIPRNAKGAYTGKLTLLPDGLEPAEIKIRIAVGGDVLEDRGDSEPWRHSRLRWLDSTIAIDDDVIPPYTPLKVNGNSVSLLCRELTFGEIGLPESIRSNGREILQQPMSCVVETEDDQVSWKRGETHVLKESPGTVVRLSTFEGGPFSGKCWSTTEFDGCVTLNIALKANSTAYIGDIRLEIPFVKDVAKYMMGFSREGGYCPDEWQWAWNIDRSDNMVWLGDFNAGLQCKLKDTEDTWEIFNLKESGVPESWGNGGKGGAIVKKEDDRTVLRIYSGERTLKAGDDLQFRFRLLITPFMPIGAEHWDWRYDQMGVAEPGEYTNIAHIHHGIRENPYINYPFIEADRLKTCVQKIHDAGQKVTLYYTVRELSNRATELWALRSLGSEIFAENEAVSYTDKGAFASTAGTGYSWLQEHLISGYAPAWLQPLWDSTFDAAIGTTGLSRWHNYYIEGMRWLMENTGIDGLYLDGIGYDREIMKRIRKVMLRTRPDSLVKFHSGNNYDYLDSRVSPLNQYMEHLPYFSDLWIGEGYDYDKSPDYWFVEISGIPFGLTSEMLEYENGGNAYRGMVYGMTGRQSRTYEPMLSFWDEFGIKDAKMIGYWDPACPVKTAHKNVLATVYIKKDKTLVSIASWASEPVDIILEVDWQALGLDPSKARVYAPPIEDFQDRREWDPDSTINVEPGKGWLLVLE